MALLARVSFGAPAPVQVGQQVSGIRRCQHASWERPCRFDLWLGVFASSLPLKGLSRILPMLFMPLRCDQQGTESPFVSNRAGRMRSTKLGQVLVSIPRASARVVTTSLGIRPLNKKSCCCGTSTIMAQPPSCWEPRHSDNLSPTKTVRTKLPTACTSALADVRHRLTAYCLWCLLATPCLDTVGFWCLKWKPHGHWPP